MAQHVLRTSLLEVERKFCGLTVPCLSTSSGLPRFKSIVTLPRRIIHDVYYDGEGQLASAGIWLRQRNNQWQAKVRRGGDFVNSQFEELTDIDEIRRLIAEVTSVYVKSEDGFGLRRTADMTTERRSWLADDRFRIVEDSMDFGHRVGEVELESNFSPSGVSDIESDKQKQLAMQVMDEELVDFMTKYQWAFLTDKPKGKLTAYFEFVKSKGRSNQAHMAPELAIPGG